MVVFNRPYKISVAVTNSPESARNEDIGQGDSRSSRERILDAGLREFATRGFEGATTRMIAERAGVNVGLIKYYFESKERLWEEAADRAFAGIHEEVGNLQTDASDLEPIDRIRLLIRRYCRFVSRRPESVRLLHDAGTRDSPRMRWLIDRHLRPDYDILEDLVGGLQRDGLLPAGTHPVHFFYIFVGAASVVFHQAPECLYLTGVDPRSPEVAEAHTEALLALMPGRGAPPARQTRGRP